MMDPKRAADLHALAGKLKASSSYCERLKVLDGTEAVLRAMQEPSFLRSFLFGLTVECECVLKSLIAIGQDGPIVQSVSVLRKLLQQLLPVERFFFSLGGIVGYQAALLNVQSPEGGAYGLPEAFDICVRTKEVEKCIEAGIESLPLFAEMIAVGGAAQRLGLDDGVPAASFSFLGRTLLEWVVEDLTARERLYEKRFHRHLCTPIALMTSAEKNNHEKILELCEERKWFHRPKESIRLFCQPQVPVVDRCGNWCWEEGGGLKMKPGGHGAIWKLAEEQGIFEWFAQGKRSKVLLRQINNPLAGLDYGLLAFMGRGILQKKAFGFLGCEKREGASEGSLVLRDGHLTNVEYCHGIDLQESLANTNILFADLAAVREAIQVDPFPGMLLNFKGKSEARLESMMQNIADAIKSEDLYLVKNVRAKTLSAIKCSSIDASSLLETPEGCLQDLQKNAQELLREHCKMHMSASGKIYFHYSPLLGPLYSEIAEKLKGGSMQEGSSLELFLGNVDIENLRLEGSLCIRAENPLGESQCTLHDVRVQKLEIILEENSAFNAQGVTFDRVEPIRVRAGMELWVYERDNAVIFEEKKRVGCPTRLSEQEILPYLTGGATGCQRL